MAVLLRNVTNALWHAFAALAPPGSALVAKSRLKVLTANIGTLLDLYGVERGLDHFRSTLELNFHHFRYYLQREVFASLPDALPLRELRECEARVEEVCWLVCRGRLAQRDSPVFPDACVYQLFRVFCLLAELTACDTDAAISEDHFQVVAHPAEVGAVASQLVTSLGLAWDAADFEALAQALGAFRFPTFLALLETRLAGAPAAEDPAGLREAVEELHQTFLLDVLKQGVLQKRGYLLPTLREYWFVLQPTELSYFKARGRDQCGCIALDPQCRVEAGTEGGGAGGAGVAATGAAAQRLVLTTRDRTIELAAPDHRSRLQWAAALRLAIAHSGARDGWQRQQAARRRAAREAEAARAREEATRRHSTLLDMERTRAQLRAEKMAREAAECAARELEAVHRQEEARLRELEDVRTRLERLLQEETAAKRDEEIVRTLQARVLAEEWEKREELERLQEEQRALLEAERRKRLEFERLQEEKERELRDAETRLRQLEEERLRLDLELRSAHVKATASEASKEVLEAKLRVMAPQLRPGDRVRRAASFAPSTRDRPAAPLLQARLGGSMRRPDVHSPLAPAPTPTTTLTPATATNHTGACGANGEAVDGATTAVAAVEASALAVAVVVADATSDGEASPAHGGVAVVPDANDAKGSTSDVATLSDAASNSTISDAASDSQ
ncbi:hypothetical protein R5R35_009871 [Gryllus longicercus]|uniref:PH domain-containing protein n=1 Tax=Gryllus longicercus TaxID=2509291 RepID=A0AAN9ZDT8_9ORTH